MKQGMVLWGLHFSFLASLALAKFLLETCQDRPCGLSLQRPTQPGRAPEAERARRMASLGAYPCDYHVTIRKKKLEA